MIIMGKPVARHGDKTACGATLVSSQSVTGEGRGLGQGKSGWAAQPDTRAGTVVGASAAVKPAKPIHYEYQAIHRQYRITQPAYLLVEGAGVNGAYTLTGYISLAGNTLTVNAMGVTSASKLGKTKFSGDVEISKHGTVIATSNFTLSEPSDWPADGSIPAGSATIDLPAPQDGAPLELKISGGYVYTSGSGAAVPSPSETSATYTIGVAEHAAD